ncbi:hypothetical protein [Lysobacter gummosus]|jgi:anthranilate phosphoribosyltransferase|uniref:hypothetical protein n=1 Tax=Lysobacter gummosus TaxID=262324 RepID=UPI003639D596
MTLPEHEPAPAQETSTEQARWLHRLRNELNAVSMACAAAQALLAGGAVDAAQENLQRARNACERGASLLDQAPAALR